MSYALWNPVNNYVVGDVVLYQAIAYQAVANNTNQLPPVSPAFWSVFGGGGGGGGAFAPAYNSFISNTTQNIVANTQLPITYDIAQFAGTGVNLVGVAPTSQFSVSQNGVYRIVFSAQMDKNGGGGSDTVEMYLRKNGTNVANTNTQIAIANNTEVVLTISYLETLTTTDVVELIAWTAAGVNDRLLAVPAAPQPGPPPFTVPAVPSIICDVQRIA